MSETASGPRSARKARPGYGTMTKSAHSAIRHAILQANLKPGTRITIKALQQDLGIGPTPIREALARLASEGFVAGEEHRGYRVPPLSLAALRDITDQRRLIECEGLRRSIQDGPPAYFDRVAELHDRLAELHRARERGEAGAFNHWETVHREYHIALSSGAQSPWLNRFQDLLFDHADRYRRSTVEKMPLAPELAEDHRRITEATLERDSEMACLLLARHIEKVYVRAVKVGIDDVQPASKS